MSLRISAGTAAVVCMLSMSAAAQAPPQPAAAPAPPATARADKPAPGIPPPAPRATKNVNIRIDATIVEARGTQVIDKKLISLTCVDGGGGSVRSSQQVPFKAKGAEGFSYETTPLNMDADVALRDDGRVWTKITVDYRSTARPSAGASSEEDAIPGGIRQSVAVVLQSGVPLMVAQSADAVGDRRVSLEVTATVLK